MNNDLYSIDFTRALPPPLKNDPNMIALAKVIAEQMQITARQIKQNVIYARIDELDEKTLDILAYDLHVDWYNYTYPLKVKRATIKDSIKVHRKLGTKYAVETALGNVFPGTQVEEWFEYGGKPYTFRVVLDVTETKVQAEYFAIKKAVETYKRLSAHVENLIYQCRIGINFHVKSQGFRHYDGYSGKRIAGTYPNRNISAGVGVEETRIRPTGVGFKYSNLLAGTEPQRNIIADIENGGLLPIVAGESFAYSAKRCGTSLCK